MAKNHTVTLVCFHRETLASFDKAISKNVVLHHLGTLPNASQALKRIWIYIKTSRKIRKILSNTTFDIIIVNNIDIVILYLLANFGFFRRKKEKTLAIEISDLREFVFGKRFTSTCMRALERFIYTSYIDKLIVTSKKYYSYHFEKFFKKDVFVLENKLLSTSQKFDATLTRAKNEKTVIGIVGLLLRKEEYIQLFETYKNHPDVEIHIHGKGHYQHIVEDYAAKYQNIIYFGAYNVFSDAQKIYYSIDIMYLVYDSNQVSLNNRLALPNKLYECMYYKVPIICSHNTYLAEIVTDLGIGTFIDYKEENAIENAVNHITQNNDMLVQNLSKLDKDSYFGDNSYNAFELFLTEEKSSKKE
ncbi:glycosyltransferase [Kordia periserrulae]|uniref:glycosyltransferase n=1 Tax=Kordia periserrulae TaxID=701523 RepID=UPI001304AD3A|nr:glycosyltransferase [Kordia periserrulae]